MRDEERERSRSVLVLWVEAIPELVLDAVVCGVRVLRYTRRCRTSRLVCESVRHGLLGGIVNEGHWRGVLALASVRCGPTFSEALRRGALLLLGADPEDLELVGGRPCHDVALLVDGAWIRTHLIANVHAGSYLFIGQVRGRAGLGRADENVVWVRARRLDAFVEDYGRVVQSCTCCSSSAGLFAV